MAASLIFLFKHQIRVQNLLNLPEHYLSQVDVARSVSNPFLLVEFRRCLSVYLSVDSRCVLWKNG